MDDKRLCSAVDAADLTKNLDGVHLAIPNFARYLTSEKHCHHARYFADFTIPTAKIKLALGSTNAKATTRHAPIRGKVNF